MFKLIINTYKKSFSGLSRETWLLSTVLLINRCGYMAVPFMGLYVTQSLDRSAGDAGLIISLFGLGAVLGATAGGKLTDVIGFKPVQIYASIISGSLFLAFSVTKSFEMLCVLSVVISFFSEAFRPANFAATAAYAAEGKATRSYSLNRLATNVGWAVGVSLGGFIASYNYQLLFIVDGIVSIGAGIFILFMLPNMKVSKPQGINGAPPAKVLKPWQDALFMKFILLTTVFATCFFLMFRVVPIFFKEVWKIDEFMIGVILGLNGVVIALFEMIMISFIEKRRTPVFYIVGGTLLVSVSFLCLLIPVNTHILVGLLCILFFTAGEMLSLPFINTFVIGRSNEFNRGQYAGGYTLSWSVASVAGPAAGFYLAELFGYDTLWVLLFILLVACAVGFKVVGKGMPGIEK
ncbi:MAG: MFS transporter [Pedobacter sp.]|nr:MAG: MFS transporter [Pedobacter sp.]